MKPLSLLLIAVVVIAGCGKKPDEGANKLFVKAIKLIAQAEAKEDSDYKAAISDYQKALKNVQLILEKYPESDLAVKLVSNETVLTGHSLAEIKARITGLSKSKGQEKTGKVEFDSYTFKIETHANNKSVKHITGKVRNITKNSFTQIEVKFLLYDSDGAKLGETLDYTNNLGPRMDWLFSAPCFFTNVARVKLGEVVIR